MIATATHPAVMCTSSIDNESNITQTLALLQQIVNNNELRASSSSSSAAAPVQALNALQGQQGNGLVNLLLNNLKQHDKVSSQQQQQQVLPTNATKPKRCLTAYNIFFQQERQKMLQTLPVAEPASNGKKKRRQPRRGRAPAHGKIGFAELGRAIGAKWKAAEKGVKDHYLELAKHDKVRYNQEMTAWKKHLLQQQQATTPAAVDENKISILPPIISPIGSTVSFVDHRQTDKVVVTTESPILGALRPLSQLNGARPVSVGSSSTQQQPSPLNSTSMNFNHNYSSMALPTEQQREEEVLEEIPLSSIHVPTEELSGENIDTIFDDGDVEELLSTPLMDEDCLDMFLDAMDM